MLLPCVGRTARENWQRSLSWATPHQGAYLPPLLKHTRISTLDLIELREGRPCSSIFMLTSLRFNFLIFVCVPPLGRQRLWHYVTGP